MAENNFKPFAVGAGANVSSQTDWENLVALSTGFTAGIARSEQINKALRQGTVMASVLGQIILEQTAEDVLDNGDTAALKAQLLTALTSLQIDSVYPVGAVLFFAQNKNPNTLFPGTVWNYIGENKTIRLGLQNGSDVLGTGGSGYGFSGQSKLTCTGIEYYRNCCFSRSGHKNYRQPRERTHTDGVAQCRNKVVQIRRWALMAVLILALHQRVGHIPIALPWVLTATVFPVIPRTWVVVPH